MPAAPPQIPDSRPQVSSAGSLSDLEIEAIDLFISFMKLIGLPKSVGEIYGLLFVAGAPLNAEQITERLQISAGAASQGLKILRSFGAVKNSYVPGERRDYFVADLDLSTFASSFIKEKLQPRVASSLERLERMERLVNEMDGDERKAAQKRLDRLKHWIDRGHKMIPWLLKFLVT